LIDAYPNKDSILKGSQSSGGGTQSTGGGSGKGSLADCKTEDEKVAFLQSKYGKQ